MQAAAILYLVDTMFGNRFWFPLFERAHAAGGYAVDAVCFQKHQRKSFQTLACCRHVYPEPEFVYGYAELPDRPDPELADWVRDFEREAGCLITDLIQADRHVGLGFQQAGLNNPETHNRRKAAYWRTLRYIRQLDGYVEEILDRSAPSLVVTSVVADLYSKLICAKARARGIPIRMFNSLQVGSLYGWYHDEYWTHPPLRHALQGKIDAAPPQLVTPPVGSGTPEGANQDLEPVYATHYLAKLKAGLGLRALLRSLVQEAKRSLGNLKTKRPDRPSFLEAAKLQLRIRRQFRELERRVGQQPEELPEPFVLYALHKEPEASTMVKAPEFNNQLAIIDLVARALPGGYTLLVKESMVSLGFRSQGFYQAVSELPNVQLVMPDRRASDLLPMAAATVVITGTVGLEAARAGIPVLSFGTRNNYDPIEHVHVVTDFLQVRAKLAELLAEVPETTKQRRARQARLYDEAAAELGIEIGEFFEAKRRSSAPVAEHVIERAIDLLLASLSSTPQPARRVSQS
ncbi:hypothetical protein [Pelagibius sp.]|uniref:hypothetical protein n=1 Tax=Pelagibius sp. TaxID=1931238 RepID=UPI00262261A0|nr:hypothetical protein [Pelagibius sp.]